MKRKHRKLAKKQKVQGKKRFRLIRTKDNSRKHRPARRKKPVAASWRTKVTDPRVVRALSFIRRTGASASEAARRERMKLKTLRKRAGRYLHQSGPGKPWRARSEDQLAVSMSLLTRQGRITVIVPNSRERRLLHQYELAVNMFRSAADGAEEALKEFEGKTIAGHELVTDIKTLIELEEGDELDYDNFYTDLGSKS